MLPYIPTVIKQERSSLPYIFFNYPTWKVTVIFQKICRKARILAGMSTHKRRWACMIPSYASQYSSTQWENGIKKNQTRNQGKGGGTNRGAEVSFALAATGRSLARTDEVTHSKITYYNCNVRGHYSVSCPSTYKRANGVTSLQVGASFTQCFPSIEYSKQTHMQPKFVTDT